MSGTKLRLNGADWRPVGTNLYNLASFGTTTCSYPANDDLARQFNEMGPNVDIVRFWAHQRYATRNGIRDWTAFDKIVAAAKVSGKRLMFTFGDHWGSCEAGGIKDDSWYTSGYKTQNTEIVSYRAFVAEAVTRYKNEPIIAFWQLMNEAEAKDLSTQSCASGLILRDFANDMASVIRAIDTNHLISLGTLAGSQCGMNEYAAMHEQMDVFEYHDYEGSAAMPAILQQRIDTANAAGKPIIMGEIGRAQEPVSRSALFKTKFDAQFAAGLDAAIVWNAHDSLHPDCGTCYGINMPNDPVWSMLGGY